ncbi:MAG: hypothetical protein L0Z62_42165, partial [Gemmataceae bacterium]|nr:hypothetical protein [Gemmataceae bacterium]
MSTSGAMLHGFAYGEHLDGVPPRSLGFRLLAPLAPQPWVAEVETLARRLHATPYPDPWPTVDLFCSVLLADGQRLIAVARYGLADHTASQRRGGLELVGVVGPKVGVTSALAVYRWLRQLRAQTEDLRALGTEYALADVLAAAPPAPPPEPSPVVPIRLWQEGVFLFAASAPCDPDLRLGLLPQGEGNWQWLPLCGADFPVQTYAQRGPLVAWTPHLSDVAVKLNEASAGSVAQPARRLGALTALLAGVLLLLLGANLWALLALPGRLATERPGPSPERPADAGPKPGSAPSLKSADSEEREKFALALHRLLNSEPKHAAQL